MHFHGSALDSSATTPPIDPVTYPQTLASSGPYSNLTKRPSANFNSGSQGEAASGPGPGSGVENRETKVGGGNQEGGFLKGGF